MGIELQPGDVVLVHGKGRFSRLIRWATRSKNEPKTWVSHVAIAVNKTEIVEALGEGVVKRKLELAYKPDQVRVFRALNIPERTLVRIARTAELYVGYKYGWGKIVLHALDAFLGLRFFRNFAIVEQRPVCSWLVGTAYASEAYTFGAEPRYLTPDDVADYVSTHHQRYRKV